MWQCQRSGDCCTQPDEVVMTHAERAEIERAVPPSGPVLSFRPHADSRFVRLRAKPCPLYDDGCTVYAVRPYNCRRFACLREDYSRPFDAEPTTRDQRRQLVVIQRKAQRWARAHGWSEA